MSFAISQRVLSHGFFSSSHPGYLLHSCLFVCLYVIPSPAQWQLPTHCLVSRDGIQVSHIHSRHLKCFSPALSHLLPGHVLPVEQTLHMVPSVYFLALDSSLVRASQHARLLLLIVVLGVHYSEPTTGSPSHTFHIHSPLAVSWTS